jgi:hypothetical protein
MIPIVALRWMLFRTEMGAGLIKLRHDLCWRDLTCLYYHYETQPLPNRSSPFFHRLPRRFHRLSVLGSHLVQIVAPLGLAGPSKVAALAGCCMILHQLWLMLCGNYSWLNLLTIVLSFSAFGDSLFGFIPLPSSRPIAFEIVLYSLALLTGVLSVRPALNLFSRNQYMNYCWNPFHLVGAYGAFGSITRARYEVVIEGTLETQITDDTVWHEYEFKAKPGDPSRLPPQIAPYHLRLDWMMWFLPFSVTLSGNRVFVLSYEEWFLRLVEKLLLHDRSIHSLLRHVPFTDSPPTFLRCRYYRYRFATREESREGNVVWRRQLVGNYMPTICLSDLHELP